MTTSETPYYVYMMVCSDQTIYTGMTNDVRKRLESHNTGNAGAKYLVQMVENGASQVAIAAVFPSRKWKHLAERYKISTGKRLQVDPRPILWRETYTVYLARIQTEEGSEQCAPDKSLSVNISAST